ncbi:hypothetical protein [Streptomyces tuirus]|uniref:hypothetical protein n=1 Tax=Streptomyces tuirus TaxID=68278 RepID=UPI003424C9CD
MRRARYAATAAEPTLMARLRSMVWGPAEFVGPPPLLLTAKASLAGCLAAAAIIGSTVAGAWYGIAGLAVGEGGLVCTALLVLYLCGVRAGRALIGAAAVLAATLAIQTPQAAAGFVLAERGRAASVVVTSVEGGTADAEHGGRYLCSVIDEDGVPMKVRIWRGCERTTRPGDAITVVYDVEGRVPPRGAAGGGSALDALSGLGGWAAGLVSACVVAVVRSCRLSAPDRGAVRHPEGRDRVGGARGLSAVLQRLTAGASLGRPSWGMAERHRPHHDPSSSHRHSRPTHRLGSRTRPPRRPGSKT